MAAFSANGGRMVSEVPPPALPAPGRTCTSAARTHAPTMLMPMPNALSVSSSTRQRRLVRTQATTTPNQTSRSSNQTYSSALFSDDYDENGNGNGTTKGVDRASDTETSEDFEVLRLPWHEAKARLRPSQSALGYDWAFYKLLNFPTREAAQAYMDRKPVPCVQRGKKWYTVDHHHTLAALELSGYDDVEVTLERVHKVDKEAYSKSAFWGYMEGRGWAFNRDDEYLRDSPSNLPKDYRLTSFRNDIYRSIGGFLRAHDVLKRGKTLADRLFFEFRWGYFFWLHRDNEYDLWPSSKSHAKFVELMKRIEKIELPAEAAADFGEGDQVGWWSKENVWESEFEEEVVMAAQAHGISCDSFEECEVALEQLENKRFKRLTWHSTKVAQPLYQEISEVLRPLCEAYAKREEDELDVPGLRDVFGTSKRLPGKVIGKPVWEKDEK